MSTFPPTPGFINSLDPANPINADFVYGSDDWHRFIQQVVLNQFQTSEDDSSNGYDIAVTAKASELNTLDGINTGTDLETRLSSIETQLDVIEPIGTIKPWPIQEASLTQTLSGSLAPGRGTWHLCDGANLDGSTTYATLYALIANQYGGADAAGMLIPDIKGRVIAGRGDGTTLTGYREGVNDDTQGNTGGEQSHTQTVGELVSHDHPFSPSNVASNLGTPFAVQTSGSVGLTTADVGNTGGNEEFNVVQPTIILAFYIRVL